MNNFEELIAKARQTNQQKDAIDRQFGLVAEGDADLKVRAKTAMMALQAAIATEDWETVAEAYCLLEDHDQLKAQNGN